MTDSFSDRRAGNTDSNASGRAPVERLDPQVTSIQPGGGVCMSLELAWGHVRRWWLKTVRPDYVEHMKCIRRGEPKNCPHEVLDPRDLKFYRNQSDCGWETESDPFAWREQLPVARVGLAELIIIGGGFLVLAAALYCWSPWAAIVPAVLALFVLSFFRNPHRQVPTEPGLVMSPADGKLVAINEIEHDEFIGGPAINIGIFLSVFNVHINRVPVASRIIGMTYRRGKFLNALLEASVRENEQMIVRLEESSAPHRRMIVRQIAGAIARRIVCWVRPGEELERGAQFGMIKLGSRTELVIPREPGLEIVAKLGQSVKAGTTIMARYATAPVSSGEKK